MKILAIETSCDETAAAVVENGTTILSSAIASSKTMHEKYGGIVPEVAAREQLHCIIPVIQEALAVFSGSSDDMHTCIRTHIDAIAVTIGPGLIGSLLVGVETAKTLSFITGKPLIPVNHVLAHMYANLVDRSSFIVHRNEQSTMNHEQVIFPAVSLVVSGGHTELYLMNSTKELKWLGGTIDDAAGECFDKAARLLGFGHGGGPAIAAAAETFKAAKAKNTLTLPRPMLDRDNAYNFSFSGLKTAVMREWNKQGAHTDQHRQMFAHEVQEAITDVLVKKTLLAANAYQAQSILISGGVAANTRLSEKLREKNTHHTLHIPPPALCTDNAVTIASYAHFRGTKTDWHDIVATPDLSVEV
jgi:N6-L-threonylcarbamoyladenine synthase